jgi:O-antigen ligase
MNHFIQNDKKYSLHFYTILFFCTLVISLITKKYFIAFLPIVFLLAQTIPLHFQNLFYAVFIAIPFSVEMQFSSSLGMDFPDEPLLILLTLSSPILLFYNKNYKKINWFHALFITICLQLLWAIVTTLYSEKPILGIKYVIAKCWFIIPAVILSQLFIKSYQNIEKVFLLFTTAMLLIACKVFFCQAINGFSFEKVSQATHPFFRNHVNYSGVLLLAGPMLWWLHRHASIKISKKIYNLLISFYFIALYFSFSRGIWVAFIVAICAIFLLKKRKLLVSYFAISIFVLFIFFYLNYSNNYLRFAPDFDKTVMHASWQDHLKATINGRDVSVVERYYRWIAATRMWEAHPVLGVGPNQYYPTYKKYTVSSFRTWVSDNIEHSSIHQYFLLLLCEQGLLGAFLFWLLFAIFLYFIQKYYHASVDMQYKDLLIALLLISSMIFILNQLSDLIETDKFGFMWFFVIGLLCNKNLNLTTNNN